MVYHTGLVSGLSSKYQSGQWKTGHNHKSSPNNTGNGVEINRNSFFPYSYVQSKLIALLVFCPFIQQTVQDL